MGGRTLGDYEPIIGAHAVQELRDLAEPLRGLVVQHINSTRSGGGVAEMLERLVPLTAELGLQPRWDVIEGDAPFFAVTKKFHNAIQGQPVQVSEAELSTYLETNRRNAEHVRPVGDVIVLHDPQPAALPLYWPATQARFLWRCHVDASQPDESVWKFLTGIVGRCHAAIFSTAHFAHPLPIPRWLVAPAIDPLSDKNCDLPEVEIRAVAESHGLDLRRPLVTQISRFDRFKDPTGVIRAFARVRRTRDAQLVLAGGGAVDDPEGESVLAEVREAAYGVPDVHVLLLPGNAHREVNALQRASSVIVQKSTREGFGLTVAEGLWKYKPVVGGYVGGIPLQIADGVNGYLVQSEEGCAYRVRTLLGHEEKRRAMGEAGHEHVRRNFVITRNLRDYLLMIHGLMDLKRPIIDLTAPPERR